MDVFVEQSVNNPYIDKHLKRTNFLLIFRYVLLVIGVLAGLLFIALSPTPDGKVNLTTALGIVWGVMIAVPFVLAFVFITRFIGKSNLEYDYVVNGSQFRIIKVVNRLKRKKLLEFSISSVESIGRITSETYDRYAADRDIKKTYAMCNYESEDDVFYIYYVADGAKHLLHIEPDNDMIIALRRSVPRITVIDKSVGIIKPREKEGDAK